MRVEYFATLLSHDMGQTDRLLFSLNFKTDNFALCYRLYSPTLLCFSLKSLCSTVHNEHKSNTCRWMKGAILKN